MTEPQQDLDQKAVAVTPPKRRLAFKFPKLKWFDLRRWAGFLLLGLLVALRIWDPTALEVLRLKVFDMFVSTHPRDADPQPIDLGNGQLRPPGKRSGTGDRY